ncbi:MAG: DJ-1/PfpI family protein [Clostridia bacterium]|nr:DJ-1/PfpI family protein [Clostridia bacterium]
MIYVFLAPGFEEIEALAVVDVLRRAELDVLTVGVGEDFVIGSHQIPVACDIYENALVLDEKIQAIVLPGGMPGTLNLEKSPVVQKAIDWAVENNKLICAICAAPSILGHKGLLDGKNATCFPGFEEELFGANVVKDFVVRDGNFITAKGMGSAIEFGLQIAEILTNPLEVKKIRASLQIYNG